MKKTIPLITTGIGALCVVFVLNLIALFVLNQPAAEFFSQQWWATWFTNYIVWGILTLVGIIRFQKRRSSQITN